VGQAPEPLRSLLLPLATASTSLAFAAMREPLSRQVASDIGPQCSRAVAGRYPLQRSGAEEISRDDFVRTFAAGGLLDGFFQRHLLAHVDVSASPWAFRGADRSARSDAAESLQSFKSARAIREAFFRDGGRQLGVALELRPLEFDPGIGEFTLDIDGQVLRFRPGNKASQSAVWPGASGNAGRVHVQLTPSAGAAGPGYTFQGPWALLRLLDRVRTEPGATPDRSILTFDVEGRKARFELKSSGGPMARQVLEQFRCPGRL
jgi:type VI secretion system protein ImpL